ncbi:MAG TPA: dienelactone hydrolase family protein [Abditibacteriaceae bacterium]|jgi:dipeptidyl aminopeptidase/acylaminoacyl peptidase
MTKKLPVVLCSLLSLLAGCARAEEKSAPLSSAAPPAAAPSPWERLSAPYAYDAKQPLDAKVVGQQDSFVASTRRLTMRGARGATVPVYILLPSIASANSKVPGVVLLHGKDGRAEDMLIGAQFLATRGYASVIPEYVGHGTRRDPANPVQMFGGEPQVLRDSIIESIQDVRRALDLLVAQPEVDATRIGLMGYSLGAIMGSITTAVEPRIDTAVLIVGGADWKTLLTQSQERDAAKWRAGGEFKESAIELLEGIDPKNFAGHIAPRPVLFINGTQDKIIPRAAAEALFEAAKEPKEQLWLEYGHMLPPTVVAVPLQEWLDDKLKSASASDASPSDAPAQNAPAQNAPTLGAGATVPTAMAS